MQPAVARCFQRRNGIRMLEIIDLSQEIYAGMPVFSGMPEVEIRVHATHEQWDSINDSETISPAVNRLVMGEHTGTHVDALNHMARQYRGRSIDTMPLTTFYTQGICLDLSQKGLRELIEPADLERVEGGAELVEGLIRAGERHQITRLRDLCDRLAQAAGAAGVEGIGVLAEEMKQAALLADIGRIELIIEVLRRKGGKER